MNYDLNRLPKRPNRNAQGFLYTEVRRFKMTGKQRISNDKHPDYNAEKDRVCLALNVHGTCDTIGRGRWMFVKKAKIEHPENKGYFKEGYILTPAGKAKLLRMKNELKYQS